MSAALAVEDFDAARRWLARLEGWGEDASVVARLRALTAIRRGEHQVALDIIETVEDATDLRGVRLTAASMLVDTLDCQCRLGRWEEAGRTLVRYLSDGSGDMPVAKMLTVLRRSGSSAVDFAAAIPPSLEVPILGQLCNLDYADVADVLEAMLPRVSQPVAVLLSASRLWASMPVRDALTWSLRLREAGLVLLCPLVAIAGSGRDPVDRSGAVAILFETGDEDVQNHLESILASWEDATWEALESAVLPYSPRLRDLLAATVVEV